jgi:endonuclease/exonuclease/phosphatase family metal-dependent hydrolase
MALVLATYNVKNLLDAHNEREHGLLRDKLDGAAAMVRACGADVVGLQEIGSLAVARALIATLSLDGYGEPIVGTADARGIRCALIARVAVIFARVETSEALAFPVFQEGDPPPFGARIPLRRGIVHAGVESPGLGLVHVMVTHFKSPRPLGMRDRAGVELASTTAHGRAQDFVRSVVWRTAEALHTRSLVDAVLATDPRTHVAVVGDMNDAPGSPVLRAVRGEGDGALFDCTSGIDASARFSIIHEGRPSQVDHVLATPGLAARLTGARFLNAALRDHGPTLPGRDEDTTIDSDHAALVVRFE